MTEIKMKQEACASGRKWLLLFSPLKDALILWGRTIQARAPILFYFLILLMLHSIDLIAEAASFLGVALDCSRKLCAAWSGAVCRSTFNWGATFSSSLLHGFKLESQALNYI